MEIVAWIVGLILVALFGLVVLFGPPFVPTRKRHLEKALDELLHLSERDLLLDLGSGSGTVLQAAANRGARAVGFELNPLLVAFSNFATRRRPGVRAVVANFWTKPFPDETTIVYIFGSSRDIRKIKRRVQAEATRLGRPLDILSYGFEMPDTDLVARNDTHHLYRVTPLQSAKPQV